MDIETYSRREEDLALAQRLSAVEFVRLSGTTDYTVDEFGQNMFEAITQKAKQNLTDMRVTSMKNGNSKMTLDEINAEIEAVRKKRKNKNVSKANKELLYKSGG